MADLLETMERVLASMLYEVNLLIPFDKGDLVSQIYRRAVVESQQYTDVGVLLHVKLPPSLYMRLQDYQVTEL
jgi:GTP-binding protein HflX